MTNPGRRLPRLAHDGAGPAGLAVVLCLALAGPGALVPLRALLTAAAQVSVAFVVDFGSQGVVKACVHVPAGSNGYDALSAFTQQEHEAPPTYAQSGLLCSINNIPSSGCGQAVPGGYIYWAYFHGTSGSWQYASSGASGTVATGDVEGWHFENPGKGNPGDPPPGATPDFTAICGAVDSTSTTTSAVSTSVPPPSSSNGSGSVSASIPRTTAVAPKGTTTSPTGAGAPAPTSTSSTGPDTAAAPKAAGGRRATPSGSRGAVASIVATGALVLVLGTAAVIRWRRRTNEA